MSTSFQAFQRGHPCTRWSSGVGFLRRIRKIVRHTVERRITTREKANVVSVVWGTDLIQFLAAALAILHQYDFTKRMNSSYSSYRPGAIHPILQISQ